AHVEPLYNPAAATIRSTPMTMWIQPHAARLNTSSSPFAVKYASLRSSAPSPAMTERIPTRTSIVAANANHPAHADLSDDQRTADGCGGPGPLRRRDGWVTGVARRSLS